MTAELTLSKANTFVLQKEKIYCDGLLADLADYQQTHNTTLEESCLDEITKEAKRLNPKNKWDHEEVTISLLVRRQNARNHNQR
jgi:hypothetical protein